MPIKPFRHIALTEGFEVKSVRDGEAAVALLRSAGAPALTITELSLPRLDGFRLMRESIPRLQAAGMSVADLVNVLRGAPSPAGSLELSVSVSDMVPAGVAYSPKGRWPKREPQAFNVNVLNDGRKSDIGESTAVHGVEVTVEALATA